MKILKYTLIFVTSLILSGCASTKRYRAVRAELIGYQIGYSNLEHRYDSLNRVLQSINAPQVAPDNSSSEQLANLENLLAQREAALFEINQIVENAFEQYQNNGIKVTRRDGLIYISMDEKLLFESGKAELSNAGVNAVREVSRLLENNLNINVIVEGHTDNKGYIANPEDQIRDNWDLSCHRATEVTRALLKNSNINPKRISAAGRSQYSPVSTVNSNNARALNRRTEIILTPQLDELWEIIDDNI